MKKQYILFSFLLLGLLIFNFNLIYVFVSGEGDNDGIDDDFEELNKRDIEISIEGNETLIESIRRNDQNKDEIKYKIVYDDGLRINASYRSTLSSKCELEFGILFRELIEFIDINSDGIYNPETDQKIQNVSINEFQPIVYENSSISGDTDLHHIIIQTVNGTFTAHIYFAEEFVLIENLLTTPTQAKIDIEISSFNFINSSSRLALDVRLDFKENYERNEETEDEIEGYAEDEDGVITTISDFTGFFTWKNNATVDGISNKIFISEYENNLYISYPNGEHIYHDAKVGIEGLLIPLPIPLLSIIILIAVIGTISASAAYGINYQLKYKRRLIKQDREKYLNHKFENNIIKEPFDGKLALQALAGENAVKKLKQVTDINITILSEDFLKKLDDFEWEGNERNEFIKEMLVLTPLERELVLNEMLKKTYQIRR
ncbi:MAG: hypothetical protein ACFE8E_14035 [Candidatus Hodarchaeota archaeon]